MSEEAVWNRLAEVARGVPRRAAAESVASRSRARYHHSPVMATAQTTALAVERREPAGSRAARRLRRDGSVPGVVYGGGEDPVAFYGSDGTYYVRAT